MSKLPFSNLDAVENQSSRQSWWGTQPTDPAPPTPKRYEVPITMGRKRTVQHGVLDESSNETFTQGQCHAFALALHHTHGWPLGVVRDSDDGIPNHWYVEHPSGAVADIHGLHDPSDFARRWDAHPQSGEPAPDAPRHQLKEGNWVWSAEAGRVVPATAKNVAAHIERDRSSPPGRYRSEYPNQLESDVHPDEADELVAAGTYVKPHMTAAKSLVRPWQKQRAGHWQPELGLEWEERHHDGW